MAWYPEKKERSWSETFCIKVLKNGPIPKHVAFIMDGNRRFATKVGLRKVEGHSLGFDKLSQTLEWCLDLGINEVTMYAFSIENFKRPKEEVDCLMDLAREKFKILLNDKEKLNEYGVHIRILGDLLLLPIDLQRVIAEAVLYTKTNTKNYLNLCLAYTSSNEMTNAIENIAGGVSDGKLEPEDINEWLLDQSLYSCDSPPPDLIVRTSGEVRLSDFLLWQSSFSLLAFFKVLWPEFSIWHLFLAVLVYQHNYSSIQDAKQYANKNRFHKSDESFIRQALFLDNLKAKHHSLLEDMYNSKTEQKLYNQ